jgi:hypothetical protein
MYIYVFCLISSINSHKVFWIMRLCRWVFGFRHFEGLLLRKSVNHAPSHKASYPIRFWMLINTAVSISGPCYGDAVFAVGWKFKLIINHWEIIMYPSLRTVVGSSWHTHLRWEANLLLVGKLVNIHCIEAGCVDKNCIYMTHSNFSWCADYLWRECSEIPKPHLKGQSCPCARTRVQIGNCNRQMKVSS